MDNSVLNIIKDGSSYVALIVILWYSISKGIPYAITKFSDILEKQNETYKDSLEKITSSFTSYMEKTGTFHEKHTSDLREIKEILKEKLK